MVNKILIDTNVLLDYLLEREPFVEEAKEIIRACTDGKVKGCMAAHSIPNMFFILRKDFDEKERREILLNLCKIFDVEGIDKSYEADYIVTRNISDYDTSEIKAILPKDYLSQLEKTSTSMGGNML